MSRLAQRQNKKRRFFRGIFAACPKEFVQSGAKPPPKLSVELRSPGFLSFCSTILRKKGKQVSKKFVNINWTCQAGRRNKERKNVIATQGVTHGILRVTDSLTVR
jgi:hypothetical protein